MPKGVYKHSAHQGFQKGHKGFVTEEGYADRRKMILSEEAIQLRREQARKIGLANKGRPSPKKGRHCKKWNDARRKVWEKIKNDPERYETLRLKLVEGGKKGLAKLHARYGTWIEERFEEFLKMFGQVKGLHFLTQECVHTNVSYRFPDFLLANNVIIEVDGENWHTPEKDKLRDAELLAVGYRVFHFTGKDIKNNPIDCCDRLIRIVNEVCCA